MRFPDHPFWDFSLETYGSDGVAPACLALQERHGVDVNFLLFCIWLGACGTGAASALAIRQTHDRVALWHKDIVRQIRAVRRRLKEPLGPVDETLAQGLRERIQNIEIDAEHVEQLALGAALEDAEFAAQATEPAGDAATNLDRYFGLLGARLERRDRDDLVTILTAVFADRGKADLSKICNGICT